ncbi:hypothetical protein ACLMJK_003307 [Lecanora helva]
MEPQAKVEDEHDRTTPPDLTSPAEPLSKQNTKSKRSKGDPRRSESKDSPSSTIPTSASTASAKRRCVSTACIACRRRKSKCDGNTPSCAACSSVYGTECVYDPNSDHRRKGVYKKDIDNLKTRNSTLQTLIQAILNFPENEVPELVKQIRTCESLDDVAESILAKDNALGDDDGATDNSADISTPSSVPKFEKELSGKMGKLRLNNGSVSIIGGTSNLIFLGAGDGEEGAMSADDSEEYERQEDAITSWTEVTSDSALVIHLLNMYFTWHYTYFTTLSKSLFWRDFSLGYSSRASKRKTEYCTPLLVNTMLALGCHFTSWPQARTDSHDSATAGDHFFQEAKRLIVSNDEHENPKLATVQALALMSVREAGCGREARGWVYSGMSFRMACDLGLNVDSALADMDEAEIDARRITIWGCFLFDKCWSNYLGRQPQLTLPTIAVPKFDVFPMEDADTWSPYTDSGVGKANSQPSRTRAVALQTSQLCEISSDLLIYFYNPQQLEKPLGKQAELKKLSELHTRLEAWRKNLPKEMEPKEGQLPNVLVMHMFFQLLFIHLFRPFLKYKQNNSPLPTHVSPRKLLTHAASMISKLLRIYKRTHGLRQICNIVVYISHSACTVHLLNLPEKNAARDIVHGLKHLEEIGESWLCARRTLGILQLVAKRWNIEVPEEAERTFKRTGAKFGGVKDQEMPSKAESHTVPSNPTEALHPPAAKPKAKSNPESNHNLNDSIDRAESNGVESTSASLVSPMPASEIPNLNGSLSMAPHSASQFPVKPPQQKYTMPQGQQHQSQPPLQQMPLPQPIWDQATTTQAAAAPPPPPPPPPPPLTSPTMLFGGVESLIQDQEWWLRDSNQMFANWNGLEHDAVMHGNSGFDMGTGNMGYAGAPGGSTFGTNGNVNGNMNGAMDFSR